MNKDEILKVLEAERERLDGAIAALQRNRTNKGGGRPGRRLSAAAKRRISQGMKKRWAERKKKST